MRKCFREVSERDQEPEEAHEGPGQDPSHGRSTERASGSMDRADFRRGEADKPGKPNDGTSGCGSEQNQAT
eukprot:10143242-Heterocapsa_arctica.AAC.1